MEKTIDLSLEEIIEALQENGYKGFSMFVSPESQASFYVNGEASLLAQLLKDGLKKNEPFLKLVVSVVAQIAMEDKGFQKFLEGMEPKAKSEVNISIE